MDAIAIAFTIDDTLDAQIKKLRGETNKVSFYCNKPISRQADVSFLPSDFNTKTLNIILS